MRLAAWTLVFALGLAGPAHAQDVDPRITAVEGHLLPAVELVGHPAAPRSLAEAMARMHVPGVSIAVIDDGRIAWAKGYGVTRAGGAPVTPDTRFQAGSISKSIAALGALRLADQGRVSVDRPVSAYLTSWTLPESSLAAGASVTLRGLLSHTAGLNVHGFPGYAIGTPVPTTLQVLDGLPPANTPAIRIVARPGEAWRYSGGGYVVAQQVIEDVTGQPFAAWMAREVLVPAGMRDSSFDQQAAYQAAAGHLADGTMVSGGHHLYPAMAAAGLWTTPSDLARALLALARSIAGEGTFLSPETAGMVLVPEKPGHGIGFDIGGARGRRWISKGGDTEGFAAFLVLYPATGDGAVVMTNGAQGTPLARDIMRGIARVHGWPDFQPRQRRAVELASEARQAVVGTYRYRGTNRFTVRDGDGGLTIVSPGEEPERLYAAEGGEFFTLSQDVSFLFDPTDGPARSGHIQIGDTRIAFDRVEEDK